MGFFYFSKTRHTASSPTIIIRAINTVIYHMPQLSDQNRRLPAPIWWTESRTYTSTIKPSTIKRYKISRLPFFPSINNFGDFLLKRENAFGMLLLVLSWCRFKTLHHSPNSTAIEGPHLDPSEDIQSSEGSQAVLLIRPTYSSRPRHYLGEIVSPRALPV